MKMRGLLEVLKYYPKRQDAKVIRRYYEQWRLQQEPPISVRCDIPNCRFHTEPLYWNGLPFKPILDHANGVCGDNRPENLRFLCPICDSQQETNGGGNRGKVKMSEGGYSLLAADGHTNYTMPVEPLRIVVDIDAKK